MFEANSLLLERRGEMKPQRGAEAKVGGSVRHIGDVRLRPEGTGNDWRSAYRR